MINLAQAAFGFKGPDILAFMTYRARHTEVKAFNSAVVMQANFIASRRVVAIKGISSEDMFGMEESIRRRFPQIQEIYGTPMTEQANTFGLPIGRHNFLVNRNKYLEVACDVRDNLQAVADKYYEQQGKSRIEDSEEVGLARPLRKSGSVGSNNSDESGATGRASFLTDWSNGMEIYNEKFLEAIPDMIYTHVPEDSPPISEVTPSPMESTTAYSPRYQPKPNPDTTKTYAQVASNGRSQAPQSATSRPTITQTPTPPLPTIAQATQISAMEATIKALQQQNEDIQQQLAEVIAMMAMVTTQLTPTVTTRSPPRERKKSRLSSKTPTPTKIHSTDTASTTIGDEENEAMSEDSQKDYHSSSAPDDQSELEDQDNDESI